MLGTFARYGIVVRDMPPPLTDKEGNLLYPEPKPLYRGPLPDAENAVLEHGKWCIQRIVYPENGLRVAEIMKAHI